MALPEEYRKQVQLEIRNTLVELKQFPSPEDGRRIWKAGKGIDFHYGFILGTMKGRFITHYQCVYGEPASNEEVVELSEIIRSHADELKAILLEIESRDDHPPEDHEP